MTQTYWFGKNIENVQAPSGTSLDTDLDNDTVDDADQRNYSDTIVFGGARNFSSILDEKEIDGLSFGDYRVKIFHGRPTDEPGDGNVLTGGAAAQVVPFELRAIELTGFHPTEPFTDLNTANPKVSIEAGITVYPNLSHTGLSAWMPANDIDYRIRIGHPDLDEADWITVDGTIPTSSFLSAPKENGVVANLLEQDIDLSPLKTAFQNLVPSRNLPNILKIEGRAITATENGGNTITPLAVAVVSDDDRNCRKKPCDPPTDCNTYGQPSVQSMAMSAVAEAGLTFTGCIYDSVPQSLGNGWQIDAYKRVEENEDNGSLTYHDGSGMIERWLVDGTDYIPAHGDNYVTARKDLNDDTIILSFPDRSVMRFDSDGRVKTWTDTNNNVLTYTFESGQNGRLTKVADGKGRETNFGYPSPSAKQPTTITSHTPTSGSARITSMSYDGNGRLEVVTDPAGEKMTFGYNNDGRIETIKDTKDSTAVTYSYFPDGRVQTQTLYNQSKNTYAYDDVAQKLTITSEDLTPGGANNRVTEYFYDGYHNVVKIREEVSSGVWNETVREFKDRYDPHLLTKVIAPNGATTKYAYTSRGNVRTVTDAQGNKTVMSYERFNDLVNFPHSEIAKSVKRPEVTEGSHPGVYETKFDFDTAWNLERVTDAVGNNTDMTYTSDGLVETITDRRGNVTTYHYGGSPKNLQSVDVPKRGGGVRTLTLEYDGFDNVTKVTDDLGNEVNSTYDGLDRLRTVLDARNELTEFNFQDGLLETIDSPLPNVVGMGALSRTTTLAYDTSNRVTEVKRDLQAGGQQLRVGYSYDGFSQVKSLKRKKGAAEPQFSFTFDQIGRAKTSTDPNSKVTTMHHKNFCVGNSVDTARGVRRVSHYDNLCRLKELEVGTPSTTSGPEQEFELDEIRESREFFYDALGRLIRTVQKTADDLSPSSVYGQAKYGQATYGGAANAGDTREYFYDKLDRLVQIKFEDDKTMDLAYDAEGNVTQVTDTEGRVTSYSYDPDNLLHKVILGTDTVNDGEFEYFYDDAGRLESINYPASTGIVAEFKSSSGGTGWNPNGQLLHLNYKKSGTLVRSFEYSYDGAGNRIGSIEKTANPADESHRKFTYDYFDRLVKVEKGPNAGSLSTFSLSTYDESDNKLTFEMPDSDLLYDFTFDIASNIETRKETNTLSSSVNFIETFSSDDDANVISRVKNTGEKIDYTWDDFDKIIAVASSMNGTPNNDAKQDNTYGVNGFRRQKKKKSGEVVTEYAGGLATAVAKSTAKTFSYIRGHQLLGFFDENDDFFVFLHDGWSSVRHICNGTNGAVAQSYEFDVFGNHLISPTSGGPNSPKTFVGGMSVNDDTGDGGLFLMGARHYDSSTQRFMSRDPIGFAGDLNLFSYSAQSPSTYTDEDGLKPKFDNYYWAYAKGAAEGFFKGLPSSTAATMDGLIPFWEPFSDCYDPVDPLNQNSRLGGVLAMQALSVAVGAGLFKAAQAALMPKYLYHFTSVEAAATMTELSVGGGLFGRGVYLTASTSRTLATLQGARSTQVMIQVATTGRNIAPTLFPGTYLSGSAIKLVSEGVKLLK